MPTGIPPPATTSEPMSGSGREGEPPGGLVGDLHGREFRKLRISLTEACQMRCFYCMPGPGQVVKERGFLGAEGYAGIVRALVPAGLRSVRLTGGEPTLRPDFPEIVMAIGAIPGVELSLTTNGLLLARHFSLLRKAGVRSVNISLDSLDPAVFHAISGSELAPVLAAIRGARAEGFGVKLNCVVLRGLNSQEIPALLEFAGSVGAELRFLELMRIGAVASRQRERFFPADEIEAVARGVGPMRALPVPRDSTAQRFEFHDGRSFGIIASETRPFCGGCSRLRLSARGELRPCLMSDDRMPLSHLSGVGLRDSARDAFLRKPLHRPETSQVAMHILGG